METYRGRQRVRGGADASTEAEQVREGGRGQLRRLAAASGRWLQAEQTRPQVGCRGTFGWPGMGGQGCKAELQMPGCLPGNGNMNYTPLLHSHQEWCAPFKPSYRMHARTPQPVM